MTRLASNEIFSPSNKIHREVNRAKDLSAPRYVHLPVNSTASRLTPWNTIADKLTVAQSTNPTVQFCSQQATNAYSNTDKPNPKISHPIHFQIIHLSLVLPNDSLMQDCQSTFRVIFSSILRDQQAILNDEALVSIQRTAQGLFTEVN